MGGAGERTGVSGRQARLLAVTWDGAGNVPPQLAVYRELVGRGHSVRVLGHRTLAASIEAAGCGFIPYQQAPELDATRPSVPMDEESRFQFEHVLFGRGFAQDVLAAIARENPDAVLVDGILFTALTAVASRGVPAIVLWHSLFSGMVDEPFAQFLDRELPALNALRDELGLAPVKSVFDQCAAAAQVVVMTSPHVDTPGVGLPANVRYVGPVLVRSSPEPVDDPAWSADDPRPLVLISFSTSFQGQRDVLQRILDALRERPVRGLLTLGPAVEPGELEVPANVALRRFVPHAQVLPAASLVVTHAGHGTVMAALSHGVPLLCVPMGRDQFLIAERVVALGVGRSVEAGTPSVELWREIQGLLEGASYRATATELSRSLDAAHAPRRAREAIEAVLSRALREQP